MTEDLEAVEEAPYPTDPVGEEIAAIRMERIWLWRGATAIVGMAALFFAALTVVQANRRPIVRYVRIDPSRTGIERAQEIQYDDLNYTPQMADIENFLEAWIGFSYSRLQASVKTTFPQKYYFLDKPIANRDMQGDLQDKIVANVVSGREPENDIERVSTAWVTFSKQSVGKDVLATGQAVVDFWKVYPTTGLNTKPRAKEHWRVGVVLYVSPKALDDYMRKNPQYAKMYKKLNPLGIFITEHHETRAE